MNPEDNIKKFFQSRLKDNSPSAEDWNTPSDDIWENAKGNFPKEDKSRRPFILWFLGLAGIIILSSIAYLQLGDSQTKTLASNQTKESITIEDSQSIENKSILSSNDNIQNQTNRTGTTASQNLSNTNSSIKNSEVEKTIKTINSNSLIKEINKINTTSFNSQNNVAPTSTLTSTIKDKTTSADQVQIANEKTESAKSTNAIVNTKASALNRNIIDPNLANSNSTDESEILNVASLLSIGMSSLTYNRIPNVNTDKIVIPVEENMKWEIGITTSPLVLPIESLINADTIDSDLASFNLSYASLNIPITRIINKKWSVTSGLYYKHGNMRATFMDEETLDIGDNFSVMLMQDSSLASIELNNKTEEFSVNLKPDVSIIDGDKITANGYGRIDFRAIQIPLLINYHIRKNRFESLFTLGVSADFINMNLSEFDLSLSKENRIITEPVVFTPLNTSFLGYSLYGAIGTKYHLNEHMNLSYTLKADLEEIFVSTHELGLHYRF